MQLPQRMQLSLSIQMYVAASGSVGRNFGEAQRRPSASRSRRPSRRMQSRGETLMHQSQWMHLSWSISNL